MDLGTVTAYRLARRRSDLALGPGEMLVAGGTWVFSEPQPQTAGLVDLTTLGWPPVERLPDGGLRIAATCPIATLAGHPAAPASGLFCRAADALLMSFKIQQVATVGGNICLALPAGAMTSLFAGLGADALIWTPGGGERREPVARFVRGERRTSLVTGEVLRGVEVSGTALARPAAFRQIALTEQGRSSSVVLGVMTDDGPRITVTAATPRPVVLGAGGEIDDPRAVAAIADLCGWFDDPHGPPDWRAAVTAVLVDEVLEELAGTTGSAA